MAIPNPDIFAPIDEDLSALFLDGTTVIDNSGRGAAMTSWNRSLAAKRQRERDFESKVNEPSVRDAISRRTLEGVELITKRVSDGEMSFADGYFCMKVFYDTVTPFLNFDTKPVMDEAMKGWETLMQEDQHRTAGRVETTARLATVTSEEEAW